MSAVVWRTRPGARGSARQRARRSVIPSRRSISASTSTPASEVSRPPSKAARTGLPATGDEKALGLGQYERAFRDNDVDARVLPGLTAEDLSEDLGWFGGPAPLCATPHGADR